MVYAVELEQCSSGGLLLFFHDLMPKKNNTLDEMID